MTSSHCHQSLSDRRQSSQSRVVRATPSSHRWECGCQQPAVLLATWTDAGQVNIKARDRYWHVSGCVVVQTVCPRCASEHSLNLAELLPGGMSIPEDR